MMKKMVARHYYFLFLIFLQMNLHAQVHLYDINSVHKIELQFAQTDWDYRMDTAMLGSETYLMADWVKIDGVQRDSVGVKYKGNSSYDSTRAKNPLNIALDEFTNQSYQGYTTLKLSNGYGDPSQIRELLAYQILRNYMHCPQASFAQVYINGNYIGLYTSAENINKKFCGDHFYSSSGSFFKCNPVSNPGPTTKSNFKYLGTDSSLYESLYELKSDAGWIDLIQLCNAATNATQTIEQFIDMDRLIWMLAFNNVFVNLDSYSGVFAQNHYTYKDQTGHFNPIIWDLNMSFGAFPFAGLGGTGMGNLTVTGMQQYSPFDHSNDSNWPLINLICNNPSYKKRYVAHAKTILNEFILNSNYLVMAQQYQQQIDTAIQSDINKLFTYSQFQSALTTNTTFGSYTIPGIQTLMDNRLTYLNGVTEFSTTAPSIISNTFSPTTPAYNSNFTVQLTAASSNEVWFCYRSDTRLKFNRVPMYDDGNHNDGSASDGVYGLNLTMDAPSIEYYFYAENNDAGIFYPARAEHEFLVLRASFSEPSLNQLVLNEFMTDNSGFLDDEYNDSEDWIELYNTSNNVLNLENVYLSDDATNLLKWKFPANSAISPDGYFVVWADDDSLEKLFHTNFNLSKDSGKLFLSYQNGSILDSITYGAQVTNLTYGRLPNGTGPFIQLNPTYAAWNNNYPAGVQTWDNEKMVLFPNPAEDYFVMRGISTSENWLLMDVSGRILMKNVYKDGAKISLTAIPNGIYIVRVGNQSTKLQIQR